MIAGVGIDLVSVSRIAEKINKNIDFKKSVFTEAEILYCESTGDTMQHFAARFAVKEAFLKATGKGLSFDIDKLKHIEVYHDAEGKPNVKLTGPLQSALITHVSITHEGDQAMAIVILEK